MWQRTRWTNDAITPDDFIGGTRLRLSYPDGNIVIGKLTVEPNLHLAGANGQAVMARIATPHSGDTWMNVQDADIEIWTTDAFEETNPVPR